MLPLEISGKTFGKFTAIRRVDGGVWLCRCVCGSELNIKASDLVGGRRTGCRKCMRHWRKYADRTESVAVMYAQKVWWAMIDRCENPNSRAFHNYGGRGIVVCDRWHDFQLFYQDMWPRPEGLTIERVDNDGPYSPDNCVWATRTEQGRNRRGNFLIEHQGETLTIAGWAERLDIPQGRIWHRINRGASPQSAVAMGRGQCRTRFTSRSEKTSKRKESK